MKNDDKTSKQIQGDLCDEGKKAKKKLDLLQIFLGSFLSLAFFGAYVAKEQLSEKKDYISKESEMEKENLPKITGDSLSRLNSILSTGKEMQQSEVQNIFSNLPMKKALLQEEGENGVVLEFGDKKNYYRTRPIADADSDWKYYRYQDIGILLQNEFGL